MCHCLRSGYHGPAVDPVISLSKREINQLAEDNQTDGSSRSGESHHTRCKGDRKGSNYF